MGSEKKSDFYDEIYGRFKHYSLEVDGYSSAWNTLYEKVKGFLNKSEKILELGCGTGQFAEILIKENYNYILGIDFSTQGILMSKERCKINKFNCENIYMFNFLSVDFDTAIALEVFEHIEKDLEIINKFPKGKRLIFSVPTFDAGAHVRFFKNEKEVKNRFSSLFTVFEIHNIGHIFIVNAIK